MFQARPIPGSGKIVFIGAGHHYATGGGLAVYDTRVDNGNSYAAVERLTPDTGFTETDLGRGTQGPGQWYCAPWPLSETYYLVSYSPLVPQQQKSGKANPRNGLGLHLLDRFGNRELIYRDPEIGSVNPIPLRPRPAPPVVASHVNPKQNTGLMMVSDVYEGLGGPPRGTIKELRIVQIFPNRHISRPAVGLSSEENARAILGTVPVEADGSASFEVPANKAIAFQALTADGFAYQTMRSLTYVQPGERISCIGCHERTTTAAANKQPLAFRRPPSKIEPGPMGGAPFSYVRFVQPVWDKHCVSCHGKGKTEGKIDLTSAPEKSLTRSYLALATKGHLVPRTISGIQISPPAGPISAMNSGLVKLLRKGHHDVKLGDDDWRRVAAWIDLNALFYGSYDRPDNEKELRGEPIPMPELQ
jgi:cytochrome c553